MDEKIEQLQYQFIDVARKYLCVLARMWGFDIHDGFWVCDKVGGTFAIFGEAFIDFDNIMFCVNNNVSKETFDEWSDYCLWAIEYNQTIPNLSSWVKGCPRASKSEMDALRALKHDFDESCEELKSKY